MRIAFVYNGAENLGIEYISAVLKSNGYSTELFFDPAIFSGDQLINNASLAKIFSMDKKIIDACIKSKPDVIAFSVYTGNYQWCLKLAKRIKSVLKVPIVFGGVHITATDADVLSHNFVDYAVIGEGEYAMLDLIKHIENNNSTEKLFDIPNIAFKYRRKIHVNSPRPYIRDLDNLPPPTRTCSMIKSRCLQIII